ncbi:sulfotransferase family protein [Inmirania thermothiophila]|uniref:Sulfotransferase family protein n=1 Tax=Inmirania thermothiophila TaxID=1750597 RepID=A0A3N1XSK3_9GAMM|nr:sulfotransferase [Inmirania thermothiophila]ROR29633.1 sulfotransferase family protein [Inmirania thermothiophila]
MSAILHKLGKLRDPEIRAKNLEAARLAAREAWWDIARPALPEPIFVVGCSRSGTTVTYETLALAPGLRSLGYEVPQLWHRIWGPWHNGWHSEAATAEDARPAHGRLARRFYYARLGAGRILDKTCINVLRVPYLARLFPDAHFVYVHRDGRDNVSSLMDGWRKDRHFALTQFLGPCPEEVAIEGGRFREWHFFLPPGWRDYNRASLAEACAHQWISANRLALEGARHVDPDRWHVLRYEALLEAPVEAFERLYARLGLEFTPAIRRRCAELARHPTSLVSGPPKRAKWKERNREAVESILDRIAPMQERLGYDA